MIEGIRFNYYFGNEAEQFTFYRIPKLLFTDDRFKILSNDAKLLYGLLLDRMSLSIKNGWLDEFGRVFIVYTIEEISKDLGCCTDKAGKVLAELDSKKGIGLVKKVKLGQGKPDLIYVMNFVIEDSTKKNTYVKSKKEEDSLSNDTKEESSSESKKNETLQVFQKPKKTVSRNLKKQFLETVESESNNNNINNNECIDNSYHIYPSSEKVINSKKDNTMPIYEEYKSHIKANIDYDALSLDCNYNELKLVNMIIELMAEIATSSKESILISGSYFPRELVLSRFEDFDMSTVQYVIDCFSKTTSDIKNIHSYLLTTIFYAPISMDTYYQQQVNHNEGTV